MEVIVSRRKKARAAVMQLLMEISYVKRGSGRVEPKTRTDSEAKTRKSRFQVQVDSLVSRTLNADFELKREVARNEPCLTA